MRMTRKELAQLKFNRAIKTMTHYFVATKDAAIHRHAQKTVVELFNELSDLNFNQALDKIKLSFLKNNGGLL